MNIIWIFLMTVGLGVISIATRKKYRLEGDVKQLCFPPVFLKMLSICFGITIVFSAVMQFIYKNTEIAVVFIILGLISALTAWAIGKYKLILEGNEIIVIYPVGKKRCVQISKIQCIEKYTEGGAKIIVEGEKPITLDAMLIGNEEFIEVLNKKGICLYTEE